jgi:hypothetical protein
VAARDADTRRILQSWLDSTGFVDAVTERILGTSAGG